MLSYFYIYYIGINYVSLLATETRHKPSSRLLKAVDEMMLIGSAYMYVPIQYPNCLQVRHYQHFVFTQYNS